MGNLGRMAALAGVFLAVAATQTALGQELDPSTIRISKPRPSPAPAAPGGMVPYSLPGVETDGSRSLSVVELPTSDFFALVGRGYDPLTDRILDPVCVLGTEPDWKLEPRTRQFAEIGVTENLKSHGKSSGSGFSFGATIKSFTLGLSTSSVDSNYMNSVDKFARAYASVATSGLERRNVKWSPEAMAMLRSGNASWVRTERARFLASCGTHYVRAVFRGHLLDSTARFKLNQEASSNADASSLSIGVEKIFGAGASSSDAQTSVDSKSVATIRHNGRGALGLPPFGTAGVTPPTAAASAGGAATPASGSASGAASTGGGGATEETVASLIRYYNRDFRTLVAQADLDTGVPLTVIVERYTNKPSLPLLSRIPKWGDDIMDLVLSKTDAYRDLVFTISDLEWATAPGYEARSSEFFQALPVTASEPDQTAAAKARLKNATAVLNRFKADSEVCRKLLERGSEVAANGQPAIAQCRCYEPPRAQQKVDEDSKAVTNCTKGLDALTPEKATQHALARKVEPAKQAEAGK
jgi:hypothetical protein